MVAFSLFAAMLLQGQSKSEWSAYGGDGNGRRFSPLNQIDRTNVRRLKTAWTFNTGETPSKKSAFEATPLFVDGVLYLSTPFNQVIALNPETGGEVWRFDPKLPHNDNTSEVTSRGVSYWRGAKGASRIFLGTLDARLIALDAKTGKPCDDFGVNGAVDLTEGVQLRDRGDYQVTSPPAVAGNVIVVGSSIGDNRAVDVERGIVRGFDARSGKLLWTWNPLPWAERQSRRTGAGNTWSVISVDAARGMVFVPTGSASPDFYGGMRPGDNRDANSVVALKAETGERLWGFQVVHHDVWDYDVAAQPALFTYKGQPAVAVATKMGHVFVLDRLTGKPLVPVEERAVPQSTIEGEQTSASQPFPAYAALSPSTLRPEDAWGPTPEAKAWCADRLSKLRNEGIFTPASLDGSLLFPGNVGGVNWGAMSIDEERGLLIANTNRLATVVRLIPRADFAKGRKDSGTRLQGEFGGQAGAPYAMYRETLVSPAGTPCNAPPWGTVSALSLKTGKIAWETPLGFVRDGTPPGSPNLGGPMSTAGGLVFDAASMDTFLRAFDQESGKELWKAELPASAQATPMTFEYKGRQYVVICAGGHGKLGTKQGDAVVAFALPK